MSAELSRQIAALCKPVKEGEPLRDSVYLGRDKNGDHLFVVDPRIEQDIREAGIGITKDGERVDPFDFYADPEEENEDEDGV